MRLSYQSAVEISNKNNFAKFPDRESGRLEPEAKPSFDCGIDLTPGSTILTMGSCFARNIEEYLNSAGYRVPALDYPALDSETIGRERPHSILNKYTVASIYQEIMWVKRVKEAGGAVDWDLVSDMAYETEPDKYLDLQLASQTPVSRERLVQRRQQVYDVHATMFTCDLFIITPGLTEAWFDSKTGMYIQGMPTTRMAKKESNRFYFENLDFDKCYTMLSDCVDTLLKGGTKQIALTVSPVPLARTFTNDDILIANTYSKSTLRSAVGKICQETPNVRYVPSYEKVMLTKSPTVWNNDLRHVTTGFVGSIISEFAAGAGHALTDLDASVVEFTKAAEAGRAQDALNLLRAIGKNGLAIKTPRFHRLAAKAYITNGDYVMGLEHAMQLRTINPEFAGGYALAAKALAGLGRTAEANQLFNKAQELRIRRGAAGFLQAPEKPVK